MRRSTASEHVYATGGGSTLVGERAALHISIVSAVDGPRFAAVAASEQECLAQVAAYVAEQAAGELWPPCAHRVHGLLAAGDMAGAVAEYFRHSGERWDTEWLVTTVLGLDPLATAWSGTVPLGRASGRT